ncbi:hypothetical protein [Sulfuriferula nivalis]|uniref:Uncharacterized protein n=1 Tax=Sulfuriferula nivalis TaxID=2675298 RepID=A0A809SHT0_9PROT|nr:hypothetical protein [Sulfuriferula nivalis]BBP01070.1 hypothetical protein SFSGTM_17780 [Sulfuriferula nivalis]
MEKMEQLELEAHRGEIVKDMRHLVEKYRAIFDWDIPEINQVMADKLIVAAMHVALDDIAEKLAD